MPGVTTAFQTGVHGSRPAANAGCIHYSCTTHSLIYQSDGSTWTTFATLGGSTVDDATISTSDITTNNASTSKHGWLKKLDNTASHFMDGTGAWSTPSGSGTPSGTSFPGSPSTNDLYFRTDLGMIFYYDGTRWLSTHTMTLQPVPKIPGTTSTSVGDLQASIAGTTSSAYRFLRPSILGATNIWLVDYKVTFNVAGGGTALGASHKWVATLVGVDSAGASTGTAATLSIASGSSATFRESTQAIGAAAAANTVFYLVTWTITGTPGALTTSEQLTYKIIG